MKVVERLYLHKDSGQDVFVELRQPLLQHQLDGIRFLYRQFEKKSPGVIVNDPAGYGKCLQVALFLSAARLTFDKPVLVLTHSVDLWRTLFEEWTKLGKELGIRCENVYEKLTMINPIDDGFKPKFASRAWGVVVLHNDDQGDRTKEFLKMRFNAQFKIWISSEDMKENLRLLSTVYEWLYPEQKFNVDSFTAHQDDWKDKIQKMIFLDAFLEDVLIRRLDILMHFQAKIDKPAPIKTVPEKTSRKNKDPTGTKVKRSKKRRIEDSDDEMTTLTRNPKARNDLAPDLEEKMDIEDFIVSNKTVAADVIKDTRAKSKDIGKNVTEKSDYYVGRVRTGIKPVSNDNNDRNKEVFRETSILMDGENRNEIVKDEIVKMEVDQVENDKSKVIVPETEEDDGISQNTKSVANQNATFIAETEDSANTEEYECSTLKWDDGTVNAANKMGNDDDNIVSDNKKCTYNDSAEDLREISSLKYDDDSQITSNGDKTKSTIEMDLPKESNSNINDKNDHDNDNTNSKMKEISNKKKVDDFDAALAALEAKALQRLKGSFLDRIF